jgi:hypothetical protein
LTLLKKSQDDDFFSTGIWVREAGMRGEDNRQEAVYGFASRMSRDPI